MREIHYCLTHTHTHKIALDTLQETMGHSFFISILIPRGYISVRRQVEMSIRNQERSQSFPLRIKVFSKMPDISEMSDSPSPLQGWLLKRRSDTGCKCRHWIKNIFSRLTNQHPLHMTLLENVRGCCASLRGDLCSPLWRRKGFNGPVAL